MYGSSYLRVQNSRHIRGRADLYGDEFDWAPQRVGLGCKLSTKSVLINDLRSEV